MVAGFAVLMVRDGAYVWASFWCDPVVEWVSSFRHSLMEPNAGVWSFLRQSDRFSRKGREKSKEIRDEESRPHDFRREVDANKVLKS